MPKSSPISPAPHADAPAPSASQPVPSSASKHLPAPVFRDDKHHLRIFQGDCLDILAALPDSSIDLIFADPPYFLSNNGITCHAGRMVSVNKGQWDVSRGPDANHAFNRAWLAACQRVLKPNGSIWVSGTSHVIHSVGFAMQQLGFKLLNDISWVKPNPPPNLSCRYFTHATETIIWAAKNKKSRHKFDYPLMKRLAGGKQMKSVWTIPPPESWEKKFGKHPTQKPVALLERILLASSDEGDLVLDPFLGSGTTLVAAISLSRQVLGVDSDAAWVDLALLRVCSDLVQVQFFAVCLHFDLDPPPRSVDRSKCASKRHLARFSRQGTASAVPKSGDPSGVLTPEASSSVRDEIYAMGSSRAALVPESLKLVHQERRFYFIGHSDRRVIFSTLASSLDDARQKFRASGHPDSDALFIIKTETEIYIA